MAPSDPDRLRISGIKEHNAGSRLAPLWHKVAAKTFLLTRLCAGGKLPKHQFRRLDDESSRLNGECLP